MTHYQALLEIPPDIEAGLLSGTLERIGGVVRQASDKQIVAWLRENPVSDLPLRSPVVPALVGLRASGQLLTLSLAVASLSFISVQLNRLSDQLNTLGETIQAEFKRDRDVDFETALELASNRSSRPDIREAQVIQAKEKLYKAFNNYLKDFHEVLDHDPILAHHYLIRAMYASTSYARCHLELEDLPPAYNHLHRILPKIQASAHQLATQLIGPQPALFFHSMIPKERLAAYLHVQQWLDGTEVSSIAEAAQAVVDIIDQARQDFWNPEVIRTTDNKLLARLTRQSITSLEDHLAQMQENLILAETLIENFQRLQSFEMELRQVRLSDETWQAWQDRVSEAELSSQGIACLRVLDSPDRPADD